MPNKVLHKVWSEHAKTFMSVDHSSQKKVLHPTLAKLINEQLPQNLLDFGCGDGRILHLLSDDINTDVYDKNPEMLELARHRSSSRISTYYDSLAQITPDNYDAVLLSMVLVCVPTEQEFLKILSTINQLKKSEGRAYIAVSHPCFRDKQFSNFHTNYTESTTFNYLKDGEPFDVYIEDEMPPSVAFTDYHWSVSFTLNKIIEAGMNVVQVIETKDDLEHKNANQNFSPYLIIIAQ